MSDILSPDEKPEHMDMPEWENERDPLEAFAQDTEHWGVAYEISYYSGNVIRDFATLLSKSEEAANAYLIQVSQALSNLDGVTVIRLQVVRLYVAPF